MATSQNKIDPNYLLSALEWHIDNDAQELWVDEPVDRTAIPVINKEKLPTPVTAPQKPQIQNDKAAIELNPEPVMGAAQAIIEAQKIVSECDSLEKLQEVISTFEGLSIKNTATNLVFSDGNPKSNIMVIGDAPNADNDSAGKAFQGITGQLLDKIFACIDLGRAQDNIEKSIYLTNLLNWRPPGNRTPTQAEIDISLPFLQKHIELIKPKIIICFGATSAKTLMSKTESISKLRGKFYEYNNIPLIVTYHPTYLIQTPAQKRATWSDILMLQTKIGELS